jgi:type IV secretory pathway VirB4 component
MQIAHYYTGASTELLTLTPEQLARHLYVIGKTGVGKSTLLENLALQLIEDNAGLIYIDPHGPSAERIIDAIPSRRTRHTCYLKATDHTPVGFNPMANVEPADQFAVADSIVSAMRHVWHASWGARLEWFLLNAVHLCIANNRSLADVPRLFSNPRLRDKFTARIVDQGLRSFWLDEFPAYQPKYIDEAKGPLLNKVGQFLASPQIRAIITQERPALDIKKVMDDGRILVVNLDKGHLGDHAQLLGSLLVSHIDHLAMRRTEHAVPCYLFIDEFSTFGSTVFAKMLSEIRKYNVRLVLAHQFISQLHDSVRDSILGNVGSTITFAVGPADAKILAPLHHPKSEHHLVDRKPFQAWARISPRIDALYIDTLPYLPAHSGNAATIIEQSRIRFGRKCSRHASASSRNAPKKSSNRMRKA